MRNPFQLAVTLLTCAVCVLPFAALAQTPASESTKPTTTSPATAPASSPDTANAKAAVAGMWSLSLTTPQGEVPMTMVVSDNAGKLAGVISGTRGQMAVNGASAAEGVTLKFSVPYQGAPMPITLTGKPAADALSGDADFGGQATGTWKASRLSPEGVTGVWKFTSTGGDGSHNPGVLTLLEKAGVVSGRLVMNQPNLDGVIKGNKTDAKLALTMDATVDGSPMSITMPGRVDGPASLAGTYSVADVSGSWTATRQ